MEEVMDSKKNKKLDNPDRQDVIRDNKGRFIKGSTGNPTGPHVGYKKQATEVKKAIFEAFDKMGGLKTFVEWAIKNKREAYKIIVGALPKDLKGAGFGDNKTIIYFARDAKPSDNSRIQVHTARKPAEDKG